MGNKPLLEVFCVTWNEEKILPDFIKWYRSRVPNCLITVIDNQSTDLTTKIAIENECKVISFTSNDEMDEKTLMDIRNSYWKESEAQWCLVVDADEWVGITEDALRKMSKLSANIYKCVGYEMFGTEEDTIDTLVYGCPSAGYCKPVLFKPPHFNEINLHPGSHDAERIPKIETIWGEPIIAMYHTIWRSWSNGIERAHLLAKRRSEHSRLQGWNIHYEFDDSVHLDYYSRGMELRTKVR